MFSTKLNDQDDVAAESKNSSVWESLIADLSDDLYRDDNDSDGDSEVLPDVGTSVHHLNVMLLSLPAATDNKDYKTKLGNSFSFNKTRACSNFESSIVSSQHRPDSSTQSDINNSNTEASSLEYPAKLRDWIHYHAKKQPATVTSLGRKMDKTFILCATKVALSLSRKLGRQFEIHGSDDLFIRCAEITVDNVVVTNDQDGDASFSLMDFPPRKSNNTSNNSESKQILALGLILYELFTQGSIPPSRFSQPLQSYGELSFASSLRISDDALSNSLDENKSTAQLSRRQRRRCDEDEEKSAAIMLQLAGVPSSLCRLVSDMLSNRDDAEFGTLFQYDKAASRFTDVILDLEQKTHKPSDFLWDTVRLSAKPTIRNKLYTREKELEQGITLAERATYYRRGRDAEEDEPCYGGEEPPIKQEVLLITGHSGSGKSSLVKELIGQLAKNGWNYLHCKFDQVARRKPLSTIASAFDHLFASLLTREEETHERPSLESIRANITQSLDEESLSILFHFIPNLRRVMVVTDDDSQKEQFEYKFDTCDTIAFKCRMHKWFYLLLMSISRDTPVFVSLDDLHFADTASLELITFIVDELGASIAEYASNAVESTNVFIVGTFRPNEIENSNCLQNCLQLIQGCCNVSVTEMTVQDLSSSDVNLMISEALCYSQRLTRSLAEIVHQKTVGNPFFVKEFLHDLTIENLLVYSFSQRRWDWNEELIESRIIADGVAEILIRKLKRLPKDQLLCLTMLSCFGSEVSLEVLNLVKNWVTNAYEGNSFGSFDIMQSLDCVAQAGLVKHTDEKYYFVHDMILNAARSIDVNERMIMMKGLLQTLVTRTSGHCDDSILFIIVDLISRIGPNKIQDTESRLLYANLNLTAATKAMQATDFASASACIECGMALLDPGHWDSCYRLSLDLFTYSALAEWAQGNTERMLKSIDEVFNNAKSFEDKLRAAEIKLDYQGMTGVKTTGVNDDALGLDVLEQLGESFPSSPENEVIVQELLDTKQRLSGLSESSLESMPIMSDLKKIQTMAFLENAVIRCYQYQSKYLSLVANRMVRITLQYGSSKYSSFGFASTALSFVTVFGDFAEGSALARMSLRLLKIHDNRLLTDVHTIAYGAVMLWRDPIQSVLPHLLDAYRLEEKSGYVGTTGHACAMFYSYRAFLSGSQLSSLGKEVTHFMRKSERDKRKVMTMSFLPIAKGISYIGGSTSQHTNDFIKEEDLDQVFNNQEFAVGECFLVVKLCCDVVFRRFDALKSIARKYLEYLERRGNGIAQYVNIHRHFYGGLVSLHFYRETHEQFWLDRATHAISKLETWAAESAWNFENKLCLLQAEKHYAFGEMEDAAVKYRLAIESARKHRFIHEEAVASEQAAVFHKETGNNNLANELMKRALECYREWGAIKKVDLLLKMIT